MDSKNKDRAPVTRRAILRGAAVAASAVPVLLAGVSAAHAKASQKAVAYQDTPKGEQSCANCRVFEPPASCKTVEGTVSPNGWCKIYIKK
jgi:hypothetical protein